MQLASNSLPLSHPSNSKKLIYVDLARDAFIPECPFSSSAFKTSTLKNVLDRIRCFADPLDYLGRNGLDLAKWLVEMCEDTLSAMEGVAIWRDILVNRGEWERAAVELSRRRKTKAKKCLKVRPFKTMADLTEAPKPRDETRGLRDLARISFIVRKV